MIPKAFVLLEKFPLTPNGKVDRATLPAPESLRSTATTTYVAPRTELEQTIATIWQEVLQIENVGLHDNFFDLGGHSLYVIQVHKKLQDQLNRELSVIELFRSPTISALAKQLSQDAIDPTAALQTTTQMDDMKSGRNRLKQRLARTMGATKNSEEVL
jgi:acyl carrier protein